MTKKNNAGESSKKPNWKVILAVIVAAIFVGVGISFLLGAYSDTNVIYQRRYAWIKGYDEIRVHENGDVYCDEEQMGNNAGIEAHWKLIKKLNKDELKEFKEHLSKDNDGEMKSYVEEHVGCFHTKVLDGTTTDQGESDSDSDSELEAEEETQDEE